MLRMPPAWGPLLLCAVPCLLAAQSTKPAAHKLPADNAAVITLDYRGGGLRRINEQPTLEVLADGTATYGSPFGQGKPSQLKLSPEQVQQLLSYILDEQKFADITPDALQPPAGIRVSGASTIHIAVTADGQTYRLEARAPEAAPGAETNGSPAARLIAIRNKLDRLVAMVSIGGADGLAKYLTAVNAKLKASNPDVPALTADDLETAWANADGSASVSFNRQEKMPGGKTRSTRANISQSANGSPEVALKVMELPAP